MNIFLFYWNDINQNPYLLNFSLLTSIYTTHIKINININKLFGNDKVAMLCDVYQYDKALKRIY